MPCALCKRNKLHHTPVAANQQMCRHFETPDFREVRVCIPIELVREQRLDLGSAEFSWRQADAVDNDH